MPNLIARKRLERALTEAQHLHSQRSRGERQTLQEAFQEHQNGAQQVSESLAAVQDNPCSNCGRCCTQAASNSGFYTHLERQMLLEQGVDLRTFLSADWEGQPEQRCLFLTQQGCNVPVAYRSNTCLGYICYDKLGPALAKQGQEYNFVSAKGLMSKARQRLERLQHVAFPKQADNFGD